jgi:hypothetical protein
MMLWVTSVAAASAAVAGRAVGGPAAATMALAAVLGTAVACAAVAVRPCFGEQYSCTAGYARQPALHSALLGML